MPYVLIEAFGEGCEARRHDVPMEGNPYDEGEARKFNAWASGWETEDRFLKQDRRPMFMEFDDPGSS